MAERAYVCSFSGTAFDSLTARQRREYEDVKGAVLADGRFSAFDATATAALARIFDRMERDPTVVMDHGQGYPWIGIAPASTRTDGGEA